MQYNTTKLIVVGLLTVVFIVAAGLDWVDETIAYGWVAVALTYILGNAQFTSREGNTSPIIVASKEVPPNTD